MTGVEQTQQQQQQQQQQQNAPQQQQEEARQTTRAFHLAALPMRAINSQLRSRHWAFAARHHCSVAKAKQQQQLQQQQQSHRKHHAVSAAMLHALEVCSPRLWHAFLSL